MKRGQKYLLALFTCPLLFTAHTLASAGEEEKVLWDTWMLTRMAGEDAGWIHSKIIQLNDKGQVRYKTEMATETNIKRFGQSTRISGEVWILEDHEGKIIEMHQKSILSGKEILYDLVVKGQETEMIVTTMGTPRATPLEWQENVLGPMGMWYLRKAKGNEPGTRFSFPSFEFDIGRIVISTIEIMEPEDVELLDQEKVRLFHSVNTNDFLPGIKTHEWWDDNYDTLKSAVNIVGIQMEFYRTTQDRARQSSGAELNADLIFETMAKSNVNLPRPYHLDSILYFLEAKNPEQGLPEGLDGFRQEVRESDGLTATVFIQVRVPERSQTRPIANPPSELGEYLEPNAYIQSDHPGLRAKALEIVGDEKDSWKAACLLERFVKEYIKDKNYGTGFATAAEVFEDPRGDCSEHGVLLAALCRAAGIPARVALGYMYVGGIFGGHMWAEVWINGEWYPIDGVLGMGHVSPTHLTLSTASLKEGGIGEAFVSIVSGLGNLKITILEFTKDGKTVKVEENFKDYTIDENRYRSTLYGISIEKPKGYVFEDYERSFSAPDFTLVKMEGESDAELLALPASFTFTPEDLRELISREGHKILSELPRKIQGRKAFVFMVKNGSKIRRVLAVLTEDTCFLLSMRMEDEDRDLIDFEVMVKSITFTE